MDASARQPKSRGADSAKTSSAERVTRLRSKKAKKSLASNQVSDATVRPPLTDEQLGAVPDIPSETEIAEQVAQLSKADKARFTRIYQLLAERLGSYAAVRAWLTAPVSGFGETPLQAIRDGMAKRVLELVQAEVSRNPPYA